MDWVVKLTKSYGQYRVTIPRELVEITGLDDVKFVELRRFAAGGILIGEYHGKKQEKGDLQKG